MNEELPEGWSVADMGTVAAIRGGIQKQPKRAPNHNAFPYLRVANVLRGRLDLNQIEQMELFDDEPNVYCLEPGDILIVEGNGSLTEIGRSALWRGEIPNCVHQNHIIRVRPRLCIPSFLEYFWNSPLGISQVSAAAVTTSGLYSLSTKKVAAVRISIAPLPEQHRIVAAVEALLEKVARAKARLDRVAAILKRFRQAVLAAACSGELTREWREGRNEQAHVWMLGKPSNTLPDFDEHLDGLELPANWGRVRVDSLVTIQNGRSFPSKEYLDAGGVRLLRPGNLHVGGQVLWTAENTVSLPQNWATDFPDFVLGSGELVMNLTAQSLKDEFLGRVCIKDDTTPALLNQRIARILPLGLIDVRHFLWVYFKSKYFRAFVNGLDTGSLIRHMHSKDVARHVFPLPPPQEQAEIVRQVQRLFALADAIEKRVEVARARAEKLPQAILSKAFSGELVATEAELAREEGRTYETAEELLRRVKGQTTEATKAPRKRKQAARRDLTPPAPSPWRAEGEEQGERPEKPLPSALPAQPQKGGSLHSLPLGAQATLPGLEPEDTPEVTTVGAALQERLAKGAAARLGLAPPVLSALLASQVEVIPNNPRATAKAITAAIPSIKPALARQVADEITFAANEENPTLMQKAARERLP